MYIAMNRFTVPLESAEEFEAHWLTRESRLTELDGFVEFHMLRGPDKDGTRLYASHTVWRDEAAFLGWTRSEQFRAAHAGAGERRRLFTQAQFEGFDAFQHISA